MVFNRVTYPNMMKFFEDLGIDMETSDMSFSVSLDEGKGYEWGSRNGLSSLFAQKSNVINPYFYQMIREIVKFKDDVHKYLEKYEKNPDMHRNETLEHFLKSHGYSELFQKAYLIPVCSSIWSCPSEGVLNFSAFSVFSFCRNHHLLQGNMTFLLCDYRQLPSSYKYDRIISCEMIEGVGHEFMEEFFGCCESLLAQDGVLVLQFISIPDERYDEYRRSSDFIKEYIFPGGCLPSLSRLTTAMSAASRLCVEHLENIGIHYYQTLICWRNNFMAKRGDILNLGFDEKFICTWEYYFMYCAAGFKSRTLGTYQVVFSRPGNLKAFADPHKSHPLAL